MLLFYCTYIYSHFGLSWFVAKNFQAPILCVPQKQRFGTLSLSYEFGEKTNIPSALPGSWTPAHGQKFCKRSDYQVFGSKKNQICIPLIGKQEKREGACTSKEGHTPVLGTILIESARQGRNLDNIFPREATMECCNHAKATA